jgi:hypothetical protein
MREGCESPRCSAVRLGHPSGKPSPRAYCPIIQTTHEGRRLTTWRATVAVDPIYSAMPSLIQPLHLLLMMFAGWVNRHQLDVIDYLQEENRVLKERLGGRRIRFTDAERRRLARKAYVLGRTIANILREHGIEPAPERDRHTRWSTFLKSLSASNSEIGDQRSSILREFPVE